LSEPPRHTLLLVDDEADVLDILVRMFQRQYHVLTATSGPEALSILRTQTVDVLVTDQRMPEMTGIELVTAAREEGIDVTALLLTGYTDPEDIIAAINRGQVYRYITKPWEVTDLLITVKNAVEFTQLRRDKERLLRQLNQRVEALFVLYEVSRASASDPPSYEAIIDRVLSAVARVLPYDCGAALIAPDDSRSAILRLRCLGTVGEKALLGVKESMLGAYRRSAGNLLPEDRLTTRVTGTITQDDSAPSVYPSQLTVSLVAGGKPVGMLSLFSQKPQAFSEDDGVLLDTLANQTADAIQSLRSVEEEARRRIERMVESMTDGVLLTDESDAIVVINLGAAAEDHRPGPRHRESGQEGRGARGKEACPRAGEAGHRRARDVPSVGAQRHAQRSDGGGRVRHARARRGTEPRRPAALARGLHRSHGHRARPGCRKARAPQARGVGEEAGRADDDPAGLAQPALLDRSLGRRSRRRAPPHRGGDVQPEPLLSSQAAPPIFRRGQRVPRHHRAALGLRRQRPRHHQVRAGPPARARVRLVSRGQLGRARAVRCPVLIVPRELARRRPRVM
jgi:CheY-like chemotaxis protein